jgi:asparagine N-glycosylation enzyme membrane subunit Stt3
MENNEVKEEKIDFKSIFLRNNYVLFFSLIALFLFLIGIVNLFNIPGSNFITQTINLFSSFNWIFLGAMFAISAVLAYFKKFKLMFIPIIIGLLLTATMARTINIPNLKDITTGNYTLGPDLDPFLYLRHAEEILAGKLQNPDMMRQAPLGTENYAYENLMPWAIVFFYRLISIFSQTSVTYAAIISPVIFFILSAIAFFFFVAVLSSFKFTKTNSSIIATISTAFYLIMPEMLHRTVAGVPEIESLGMVWFWLAFLFFTLAWKSEKKKSMILFGILSGIFTGSMIWTWGGFRYIFMTFALVSFIIFLFEKEKRKNFIIYISWILPSLGLYFLKTKSIGTILFSITDSGFALTILAIIALYLILFKTKIGSKTEIDKIKLPKTILSILVFAVIAIIGLIILKPSMLTGIFNSLIEGLLHPFGEGRVGLTVAENKAPYFTEVLGSFGYLFWIFFFGIILLFYETTKHFNLKNKIILNISFIAFICGLIFSRISPENILNGENFISNLLYFGGLVIFVICLFYIFINAFIKKDERTLKDFKEINFSYLFLLAFSFWMIISMRGAIRLFFMVSLIIAIIPSFFVVQIAEYGLKIKNNLGKVILWIIFSISVLLLFYVFVSYTQTISYSVKATVPDAYAQQWQQAMGWVRNNTAESSIFVHWWDYGYWIQTLGKRPTVTDGGHANGWWDHTTARYLMTTPHPNEALSLMKTYNVSYLLIDSTDLGKYPAYSSIGSGASGEDRYSWIPIFASDPKQTQEKANSTIRVYQGGTYTDSDIIYNLNGQQIFLPKGKAVLGGVILETSEVEQGKLAFNQLNAVFIYNNKRFDIPIKNVYYNGQLLHFQSGIDATIRFIPTITQADNNGLKIDDFGAAIYLSEKTEDSLFAQLYLMNDPNKLYPTVKIAHVEDDNIIKAVKQQIPNVGEFIYYQGFRGPIKIWKVDYPENILTRNEFLKSSGIYGELDNLQFIK